MIFGTRFTVILIFQILLGLLRLGSLSVILSEHLVSGLVTGTAILVIASQLKYLFGMNSLPKHNGSLQLIYVSISDIMNRFKMYETNAGNLEIFSGKYLEFLRNVRDILRNNLPGKLCYYPVKVLQSYFGKS